MSDTNDTERYPTIPGNAETNVTRYPPLRGNGNGHVPDTVTTEKHYRVTDRERKAEQIRQVREALGLMMGGRDKRSRP